MSVWRDIRHGGRLLARAPGFTALAVTVLGVGIGAAVTMFTVIDAVLFRPLPFPASERLVQLWEAAPDYSRIQVFRRFHITFQCEESRVKCSREEREL